MNRQEQQREPAVASPPDPARYDNRVLQEWPRVDEPPRVWIGSLDDYEDGRLHGRWVGVARPPEEIRDDIAGLLSRSPIGATRWAVFDAEGFGHFTVTTTSSIEELSRAGLQIKAYGGAFAAWARLHERDLLGQLAFRQAYLGHYPSVREYVELYVDARNIERLAEAAVPAEVRPYIELNVAQLAADMVESGDVLVIPNPDGGVWIFDARSTA